MQKENLWSKLKREGKLKLVEPSEEIRESYVRKSESNLESARLLLDNDKLEEAVSLAYYSMYNMLTALLFKAGIKSENHTASIELLKKLFNKDNTLILNAKKERIDKQYYIDFKITRQDVIDMIKETEEFNNQLNECLARITNDEIKEYRKEFKELINKY